MVEMKRKGIKEFLKFRTLHSKIILMYVLFSIALFLFMNLVANIVITSLEENLMSQRLQSDINYIEDLISANRPSEWKNNDGTIYFGDVLIGDGTEKNANHAPFLLHQKKTGTLAYVFVFDPDADLEYVKKTKKTAGYEEGHYLRVAGSTKNPEGKSIVGTYITKNVADSLDTVGSFSGEVNVVGGMIYCYYKRLDDADGNTVGAIVVGRYIAELKAQVSKSVNKISFTMIVAILICGIFTVFVTSRWTSAIKVTADYLKQIEDGNIPEKALDLHASDEMKLISDAVNRMVMFLRENTSLRKKSETDPLTGLPNRFGYEHYSKKLYWNLIEEPKTLAVEILDIDFFKEYNDNYGHAAGDACIKIIAEKILYLMEEKENIFAFRYGGDEFVIIYSGYSKDEIEEMVCLLKESIENCNIEHQYSQASDKVSITQGVCIGYFSGNHSIVDFFEKADEALYHIKKLKRNDYCITNI